VNIERKREREREKERERERKNKRMMSCIHDQNCISSSFMMKKRRSMYIPQCYKKLNSSDFSGKAIFVTKEIQRD